MELYSLFIFLSNRRHASCLSKISIYLTANRFALNMRIKYEKSNSRVKWIENVLRMCIQKNKHQENLNVLLLAKSLGVDLQYILDFFQKMKNKSNGIETFKRKVDEKKKSDFNGNSNNGDKNNLYSGIPTMIATKRTKNDNFLFK